MRTAELTGAALDWAVAKCEGEEYRDRMEWDGIGQDYPVHKYSTEWECGGSIIEQEGISTLRAEDEHVIGADGFCIPGQRLAVWCATTGQHGFSRSYGSQGDYYGEEYQIPREEVVFGPTPLIAAMRCYVASKLGGEVKIPPELT